MKGLLIKDFIWLSHQGKMLAFMSLMMLMLLTGQYSFVMIYLSMVTSMLAVNTISYDEFDNGYAFLFTLPITRKSYVQEKYVFGVLCSIIGWLVSLIGTIVYFLVVKETFVWQEILMAGAVVLLVVSVSLAFILPLQLKFGSEKARTIRIILLALVFGSMFAVTSVIQEQFQNAMGSAVHWLEQSSTLFLGLLLVVVAIVIVVVSMQISIKVMEKKEF